MKRLRSKIALLLASLLLSAAAYAQRAVLNPGLINAIESGGTETVSLLAQGDADQIEMAARASGGWLKYSVQNISAVSLPLQQVYSFANTSGATRIEGLHGTGILLDDMTNLNTHVTPVHEGYAPLSQGYDGRGVVMAFFDSGIEFNHGDFKKEDGTTRIRYLWDQALSSGGTEPEEFGYGQEWDSTAIDNGECTHFEWAGYFGHGSNVAGIGAGNGLAINNFVGVAPGSDIISVSILFDANFLLNVADATKYAFDKAAAMGKPCVINASLGTYFGSHDGRDLPAQLIAALIDEQNGRSFVCAAGNAAAIKFHLGYEAEADSAFTWFYYSAFQQAVFHQWWIEKQEAAGFNFAIGADLTNPYTYLGRTKYYNLETDFNYVNNFASIKDTLFDNATRLGIITIAAYRYDSSYACDISIKPDLTTYYWRFITQGSGRFDTWSGSTTTGTSDMIQLLPDTLSFPDIQRYRLPDNNQTIVSSFSCSDKTITVGNYTNRNQYLDYYGDLQSSTDVVGALAVSSSYGPTRDGRVKPELTAPGNNTLTTGQFYTLNGLILYQPWKVAPGGMHNRNGGTSMASPVVAGIAALYLQKKPEANWKEVKDAIVLSAKKDSLTGFNLPDNKWGFGKANAFDAITMEIVYGCTEPSSLNFNPAATVDDGSCIPIVFGCTDADAINYSDSATVDDGSCNYELGMNFHSASASEFFSYPNPSNSSTRFFFSEGWDGEERRLVIGDVTGINLLEIVIPSTEYSLIVHHSFAPGIYFCRLEAGNSVRSTLKLIVQ
jgi:subtilisin family serine protease